MPALADTIANLTQSKAIEQMVQVSKGDSIPIPLKVLEQGSLLPALESTLMVLPSKDLQEQDSDVFTSSSDKVI